MRVLQVGSAMPDDWGGIERYLAYVSPGLARRGLDVCAACVPDSPLAKRVGVPVIPVRCRGKYDFAALATYLRLFRREKFDIVNVHFSPDYLMAPLAAKLAGQKGVVMTRHVAVPIRRSRVRTYRRLVDAFVGVSGAVVRQLATDGLPAGRTYECKAGVPVPETTGERSLVRHRLGIGPENVAVGLFGRLVAEKGHGVAIDAAGSWRSGASLHVFGSGPLKKDFENRAQSLSHVHFHGYVEDVADCMAAMDVVLVPSLWEEALGLVVLEAMALGLPVAASRIGGIPEVVQHGVNGVLFAPGSPVSLVTELQPLLDSAEARRELGAQGRRLHQAEFTPERFAERQETVYRAILSATASRIRAT